MRLLIQRVSRASVTVDRKIRSSIGSGLLVFAGIEETDDELDIEWLVWKMINLRVFPDNEGVMNKCLTDIDGELLIVSQFTLLASTKKGNRPSYIRAARPEIAVPIYETFVRAASAALGKAVQTGEFGTHMQVSSVNDGPVTIWIDSKNRE